MPDSTRPGDPPGESRQGRLFVVSTPIGNLEDVTLRALRILKECRLIAAEDTRRTRKLLSHYDIHTPLTSFYQQRQTHRAPGIVAKIKEGADVALVTDAGTPGISDPGVVLVRLAVEEGIEVTAAPGPSAFVTLLSLSGLPSDRFAFEGFLPLKSGKRKRRLQEIADDPRTHLFYEAPQRLGRTLALMGEVLGDRRAAVGRELTKLFEEVRRGTLSELADHFGARKVLGEVTLAVEGKVEARRGGDGH